MYSILNQDVIPRSPRGHRSRGPRRLGLPVATIAILFGALAFAALCVYAQSDPPRPPAPRPARPRVRPTPAPLPLPSNLHIPAYTPGPSPFRDGETLVYRASWMGVPAAEARVLIARAKLHPELWTGTMWLNTSAVVDIVYRMRDVFHENFDYISLRPHDISILQHEKQRLAAATVTSSPSRCLAVSG